jgi:hypothetical protein
MVADDKNAAAAPAAIAKVADAAASLRTAGHRSTSNTTTNSCVQYTEQCNSSSSSDT